jgi:2-iminobutanoate/2-iminopropanoate deaminase
MRPDVRYPQLADTPVSHLPFSPGVIAGGLLFVSGQASVDAQGNIVPDTFEGEFRRALDNVTKILHAAGSELSDVVQTRNYVRDPQDLAAFNQLYREYFRAPFPARTTIVNCLPESLRYEIEVVATAPATNPSPCNQSPPAG